MRISFAHRSPDLKVWSLSTFHTTCFIVIVALGLHLHGTLPDTLRQLDTALGFAAFIILWAVTCAATSWGVRYAARPAQSADPLAFSIAISGGWNGVAIFAVLFAVFTVRVAMAGSYPLAGIPVLFLGVVVGSLLAFTIGTMVGLVFGLIDTVLIRVGSALFEWIEGSDVAAP
jgi:hypothetical protein